MKQFKNVLLAYIVIYLLVYLIVYFVGFESEIAEKQERLGNREREKIGIEGKRSREKRDR